MEAILCFQDGAPQCLLMWKKVKGERRLPSSLYPSMKFRISFVMDPPYDLITP